MLRQNRTKQTPDLSGNARRCFVPVTKRVRTKTLDTAFFSVNLIPAAFQIAIGLIPDKRDVLPEYLRFSGRPQCCKQLPDELIIREARQFTLRPTVSSDLNSWFQADTASEVPSNVLISV